MTIWKVTTQNNWIDWAQLLNGRKRRGLRNKERFGLVLNYPLNWFKWNGKSRLRKFTKFNNFRKKYANDLAKNNFIIIEALKVENSSKNNMNKRNTLVENIIIIKLNKSQQYTPYICRSFMRNQHFK